MNTQRQTYYTDLKAKDRLKFFRRNALEGIVEVDDIIKGDMVVFIKDEVGTYKTRINQKSYKMFFNIGLYNVGSRHRGRRTHIKLELPKFYEWRKE